MATVSTRNSRRVLGVFLALLGMPLTPFSQSQIYTSYSAMPVKVEIIQACTISAADLDFGQYNLSSSSPLHGQTAIQMTCGVGVIAELSLDNGLRPGPNTSRRVMQHESSNDRLNYDLFQDAGRSIHWGDKSGVDTR